MSSMYYRHTGSLYGMRENMARRQSRVNSFVRQLENGRYVSQLRGDSDLIVAAVETYERKHGHAPR